MTTCARLCPRRRAAAMVLPVPAPVGYETRLGPPAGCAEPDRGKRRPDSALRLESYLGRKWHGQVNRSAVWSVTGMEECLRWPLRGAVTAASQHRACTARPGGEPAVRKPRTAALSAGSPLAVGAAAAHRPPKPIRPGGRAKQHEQDQQPPDRREPDAARGYVHALTWSAAHSPPAGEPPPRGQRRRPGQRAFLLTPAGGTMSHRKTGDPGDRPARGRGGGGRVRAGRGQARPRPGKRRPRPARRQTGTSTAQMPGPGPKGGES